MRSRAAGSSSESVRHAITTRCRLCQPRDLAFLTGEQVGRQRRELRLPALQRDEDVVQALAANAARLQGSNQPERRLKR